jgi:hypothetical protein
MLATNLTVCVGRWSVSWDRLSSWYHNCGPSYSDSYLAVLNITRGIFCATLSDAERPESSTQSRFNHETDNSLLSAMLVDQVLSRQASNPKDKVYGLYSLFLRLGFHLPPVDYEKAIESIFEEFVFSIIQKTRCLLIYNFLGSPVNMIGAPSWVPDLREPHLGPLLQPAKGSNNFREAFELEKQSRLLILEGSILGSLTITVGPLADTAEPSDTDSLDILVVSKIIDFAAESQEFGDCPNGESAEEVFQNVVGHAVDYVDGRKLFKHINAGLDKLDDVVSICTDPERRKAFADYNRNSALERLSDGEMLEYFLRGSFRRNLETIRKTATTLARCTLVVVSTGWMGIVRGTLTLEEGDLVALVHGSTIPMIIRPTGMNHYRLVGLASIGGIPEECWPTRDDGGDVQKIILE